MSIIVGGGGHGLATAYYLAKEHGVRNIAVLEKGWIGGGNTGRNTTIVRSNYLWTEASLLYEKSMKLWEGLSQDLNYNVMFSASAASTTSAIRCRTCATSSGGSMPTGSMASTPKSLALQRSKKAIPYHQHIAGGALSDSWRLVAAARRRCPA